eukprot:CAMPEP_0204307778 /NCGR_PEP_ID=MMETSP0469-20131031/117_1 /ASSEMBLY_ACC=CAM_ASM_000384 /TAXON_ID=2969 /ORGANISM="Oxyrrhis marina" /LENGTH=90 /DNA_ID=CAMNT_0051287163 /DNA_START=202 /DNA_END=471 /DNA_ORIENTATION=+
MVTTPAGLPTPPPSNGEAPNSAPPAREMLLSSAEANHKPPAPGSSSSAKDRGAGQAVAHWSQSRLWLLVLEPSLAKTCLQSACCQRQLAS